MNRMRERTQAKFIIAFDNDKNGVGQQKADECVKAVHNSVVKLPSIIGDFNDLHQQQGLDKVQEEEIEDFGFRDKAVRYKNLVGSPPPIEWLVDRFIPLKAPGVLSSVGGIGKSFLAAVSLELGKGGGTFLGKNILQSGNSVVLSSEDNQEEIHRRINF